MSESEDVAEHNHDAVIFVPGLGGRYLPQDIDTIGAKIAGALERNSEDVDRRYRVKEGIARKYADGHLASSRQIVASSTDDEQVVADLFEFDYHDSLRKAFDERSLPGKIVGVLATLLGSTPAYLRAIREPGKTRSEKAQLFLAGGMLGVIALYFLLLLAAAGGTVYQLASQGTENNASASAELARPAGASVTSPGDNNPAATPPQAEARNTGFQASNADPAGSAFDDWIKRLQAFIVIVTGLGALKKDSIKDAVSEAATTYVTAIAYIQAAARKQSVTGQLTALVEDILESQPKYRRVHLVSYSFGSLIALDTLFSRNQPAAHLGRIDSLVTIGCPFDMVRTFWPEYFQRRLMPVGGGLRWCNVYSSHDVLGSNFRNDSAEAQADQLFRVEAGSLVPDNLPYDLGIGVGKFSLLAVLTLRGLAAHQLYWEGRGTSELSCFDLVMPGLLLAGGATPQDSRTEAG